MSVERRVFGRVVFRSVVAHSQFSSMEKTSSRSLFFSFYFSSMFYFFSSFFSPLVLPTFPHLSITKCAFVHCSVVLHDLSSSFTQFRLTTHSPLPLFSSSFLPQPSTVRVAYCLLSHIFSFPFNPKTRDNECPRLVSICPNTFAPHIYHSHLHHFYPPLRIWFFFCYISFFFFSSVLRSNFQGFFLVQFFENKQTIKIRPSAQLEFGFFRCAPPLLRASGAA
ncbi:hypothetical protein DFJ73DRAFT_559826 [Zopfochytrium polystomum]|nr:hypothetical protein DFJ73DRAFT_559826 [Zopfochytrium polystomum]